MDTTTPNYPGRLVRAPPGTQQTAFPGAAYARPHFYTSAEIYEREKERIFQKEWLCMGAGRRAGPGPGDYLTFRVAGEPVAICKDGQGEIRAFSNVCRHRGDAGGVRRV